MTLSYIPSDTNDEGVLKATASGVLPNGKAVIVNADGTVSVVAETSFSEATGSATVFESAASENIAITFDSNLNKIVIAFRDTGNSNYGTAIVGTVSSNSISFGTAVVFESAATESIAATFDTNSNKVVLCYKDSGNSSRGTSIVGTVSGTGISFGSAVVFDTSTASDLSATFDTDTNKVIFAYQQGGTNTGRAVVGAVSGTNISFGSTVAFDSAGGGWISVTYDSSASKVVIAFTDDSNSYGTAIVGTVSGTAISFGTKVVFESASSRYMSAAYDSSNNKVIIGYSDLGNSTYATAVVGTVSGTAISFGTPVVFESAAVYSLSATYDIAAGKVTISYSDDGNGQYGTLISGTVSGTTISFGSPSVFESAVTLRISSAYDSNSNKVVVAYADNGNSAYGTSVVHQNAYTSTNITAENYIGISTGGTYASGSNATVKIIGNTSNDQSSLTAGQSYFVQTNGTIGTTAASPSVFAGTAISATRLIVKT